MAVILLYVLFLAMLVYSVTMASIAFANSVALQPSIGNATSNDTPQTIVKRDGSGNFSAGIITSNLIGNVTGNINGSASSLLGPITSQFTVDANSPLITAPALVSLNPTSGNVALGFGQTVSSPTAPANVGAGNFIVALSTTQFVALYAPINSTNAVTAPATVVAGTLSGGIITWGTPIFANTTTGGTTGGNNNPFNGNIIALDNITFAIVWSENVPVQKAYWTIGQVGASNTITIDPGISGFLIQTTQASFPTIMSMNFTNSTPGTVGGNLSGQIVVTCTGNNTTTQPTALIWTYGPQVVGSIVYTAGVAAGNLSSGPKYFATSNLTSTGSTSVQLTSTTFLMFYDTTATAPSVLSTLNVAVGTISGSGAGASISYGTATTTTSLLGWHNWSVFNRAAVPLSSTLVVLNYLPTIRTGYSSNFGINALLVQISGTVVTLPVPAIPIGGLVANTSNQPYAVLPLTSTTYALGLVIASVALSSANVVGKNTIPSYTVDANSPNIVAPAVVSLNPNTGGVTLGFGQAVSQVTPIATSGAGIYMTALSATQYVVLYSNTRPTNALTAPAAVCAGTLSGNTITWGTPQFLNVAGNTNSNINPMYGSIVALDAYTFAIVWIQVTTGNVNASPWTIGQVSAGNTITLDSGVPNVTGAANQIQRPNILSMNFTNSGTTGANISGQIIITCFFNNQPAAYTWTYSGIVGAPISYTLGTNGGTATLGKFLPTASVLGTGTHSVMLTPTTFLTFYDTTAAAPSVLSTINIVVGTLTGSGATANITYGTVTTTSSLLGWYLWNSGVQTGSHLWEAAAVLSPTLVMFNYLTSLRTGNNPNFGINGLIVQISGTSVTLPVAAVPLASGISGITDISVLSLTSSTWALGFIAGSISNMLICSISGTTITPNPIYEVGAGLNSIAISPGSTSGQLMICLQDTTNTVAAYPVSYVGTVFSRDFSSTGLRPIGVAITSGTAGQNVSVQIFGVVNGFSGLLPGITYYGASTGAIVGQVYQVNYPYGNTYVLGPALTPSSLLLRWNS